MGFLRIFSEPYPCDTTARQGFMIIAGFSLFVFLFLFLFQPFGLNRLDMQPRFFITLGYGFCTALAIGFNLFVVIPLFPQLFDEDRWTVGRQILWICWMLITVTFFNILFSYASGSFSFSLLKVFKATAQVLMVGIFPVCVLVLLDYLRLYRKHARKAGVLNHIITKKTESAGDVFNLVSENEDQRLRLTLNELLYLTSADNYVSVVYRANGSIKKTLLRGTLKHFDRKLEHPCLRRCHRSFIVNLFHLLKISGNAQGYTIKLRGTDSEIPVSRSYADDVLSQIEQL